MCTFSAGAYNIPCAPLYDQGYIAGWSGHARLHRLLFISDRSVGKPLELESLKLLHNEVKKVSS